MNDGVKEGGNKGAIIDRRRKETKAKMGNNGPKDEGNNKEFIVQGRKKS